MEKLNLSIGPVMMEDNILQLGANQVPYFRTEEFSKIMLDNEILLKKISNASIDSRVIFLTSSGTGAMEASIINLFDESDKLLIVDGGTFGHRFCEICDVHNLNYERIHLDFQEQLTEIHLEKYDDMGFTGFLVNIHETSTGVLYDIDLIKKFCVKNNIFLVVDAISSFIADKYNMHNSSINVSILSTHKGLALPPGISIIILDKSAINKVYQNKVRNYYFNFKSYLDNGVRGQTPFTPAVSILIQLNSRLKEISEKGIFEINKEIEDLATYFRFKVADLPFEYCENNSSNAITLLRTKENLNASKICEILKNKYNIFVNPNGGLLSEKVFRVGHVGAITKSDIDRLILALRDILKNYKYE